MSSTNGKIPPPGASLLAYQRELAQSQVPPSTILYPGLLDRLKDGASTYEILGETDEINTTE